MTALIPAGSRSTTSRIDGPPAKLKSFEYKPKFPGFTLKRPPGAGNGNRSKIGSPPWPKKCWKRDLLAERLRERERLEPADCERILGAPVVEIGCTEADDRKAVLGRQRSAVAPRTQVCEPEVDAGGERFDYLAHFRILGAGALPEGVFDPPAVTRRELGSHADIGLERERSEQLAEPALGEAAKDVHLEEALRRRQVTLDEGHRLAFRAVDMEYAELVDHHVCSRRESRRGDRLVDRKITDRIWSLRAIGAADQERHRHSEPEGRMHSQSPDDRANPVHPAGGFRWSPHGSLR